MTAYRETEPTLGIEWRVWRFRLHASDYGLGYSGWLLYDGERVAHFTHTGFGSPHVIFRGDAGFAEDAWRVVAGMSYSETEGETVARLLHDAGLWPTSPDWQPSTDELKTTLPHAARSSTPRSGRPHLRAVPTAR